MKYEPQGVYHAILLHMSKITTEQLKAIFDSERAQEVQKIIERDFLLSVEPLFKEDGAFEEDHWVPVDEPILLNGVPWKALVLRLLPSIDSYDPPLLFSAVRLVPPDEIKEALKQGRESEAHREASDLVTNALSSPDMARLKLNLVRLFEEGLYKDNHYLLFPTPTLYALQPNFHYDVLIPFVSLKSLDPTIE